MRTKIIEATNGPQNWGKFLLGRFDQEWNVLSEVAKNLPLLRTVGWGREHILVLDLQTGEGVIVRPGGSASSDLNTHQVWVCPLFEPFLKWLYKQDLADITKLPAHIDLPDAEFAMHGYRREGRAKGASK